jgi:hypothetical protein
MEGIGKARPELLMEQSDKLVNETQSLFDKVIAFMVLSACE